VRSTPTDRITLRDLRHITIDMRYAVLALRLLTQDLKPDLALSLKSTGAMEQLFILIVPRS